MAVRFKKVQEEPEEASGLRLPVPTAGPAVFSELYRWVSGYLYLTSQHRNALEYLVGGYIASFVLRSHTSGERRPAVLLFTGEPGVGKSTLPSVVRRGLDTEGFGMTFTKDTFASNIAYREKVTTVRKADGYEVAVSVEPGPVHLAVERAEARGLMPVIILNEVDKVPPTDLNMLLEALNDGVVTSPYGTKHPFRGLVVLTTNEVSRIPEPLLDRVTASVEFGYPSVDEAEEMVKASIQASLGGRGDRGAAAVRPGDLAAAAKEFEAVLQVMAADRGLRRCAAAVVKTLQGVYPGVESQLVAERVRKRPGERAAADIIVAAAMLYTVRGEFSEELVREAIAAALWHRFEVVPGESKDTVLRQAMDCQECQRFFRGHPGVAGAAAPDPQPSGGQATRHGQPQHQAQSTVPAGRPGRGVPAGQAGQGHRGPQVGDSLQADQASPQHIDRGGQELQGQAQQYQGQRGQGQQRAQPPAQQGRAAVYQVRWGAAQQHQQGAQGGHGGPSRSFAISLAARAIAPPPQRAPGAQRAQASQGQGQGHQQWPQPGVPQGAQQPLQGGQDHLPVQQGHAGAQPQGRAGHRWPGDPSGGSVTMQPQGGLGQGQAGRKAYLLDRGAAAALASAIASAVGSHQAWDAASSVASGLDAVVAGVVFARSGNQYAVYPLTKEAAEALERAFPKVASKSSEVAALRFSSSAATDFDKVLTALRRAGLSLRDLVADPVSAGVRAIASEIRAEAAGATAHISEVLHVVAHLVADRASAHGEVQREVERILRYSRKGSFRFFARGSEALKVGRLDLVKTAASAEMFRDDPVVARVYTEDAPRVAVVVDTSGSMGGEEAGLEKIVYAAALAALISNSVDAVYDLYSFNAASYRVGSGLEREEVIRAAAAMRPGGGTSYAAAIEHVVRESEAGTTVFVVGDFIDNSEVPADVVQEASRKDMRFVLVPVPGASRDYLEYLARALGAEVFTPF